MVGDVCFRVGDGDDVSSVEDIAVGRQVCGKAGEGRGADQFAEFKVILLDEKSGSGHFLAAQLVPESDLRFQEAIEAVQLGKSQTFILCHCLLLWDTDGEFFPKKRNAAQGLDSFLKGLSACKRRRIVYGKRKDADLTFSRQDVIDDDRNLYQGGGDGLLGKMCGKEREECP